MHAGEVCGVVTKTAEILDAVITTQIPPNMVVLFEQHLCYGRGPTAAPHYCDVSYHVVLLVYIQVEISS